MKNLKNTAMALGLTAVLGLGAVSANARLLISDRSAAQSCDASVKNLAGSLSGIILAGLPVLNGTIVMDRIGLMISDRSAGCVSEANGTIVMDSTGVIVMD